MVRSFYHRLINTILLLAVIIIGVIFVAQNNHLESLALKAEQEGEQEEFKSQAATHGNPAAATLWADSIPGGLLVKDPEPWLPEGHTNGGTLKLLLSTDPKGFNYLIENSVDVSNIAAYNLVPLVARHKKEVTKYDGAERGLPHLPLPNPAGRLLASTCIGTGGGQRLAENGSKLSGCRTTHRRDFESESARAC